MLFSFGNSLLESEKERNLYYKFFAGYFFNELVPGCRDRLHYFATAVNDVAQREIDSLDRPITLSPQSTHVSFDCHAYLFGYKEDRGEFADIMLHDTESKCLIAVEAKFLTNWSYEKDVRQNARRLDALREAFPDTLVIQCLLVTENKWNNAAAMAAHKASNYSRLKPADVSIERHQVVPIFWDQLIEACGDSNVRAFFKQHLLRNRGAFRLNLEVQTSDNGVT